MRPESRNLIPRLSRVPPLFYGLLLLFIGVAYAWRPLEGGTDFWAHAAVGKWIWVNQNVPRRALFLWSEPNFPWVAHSWLSQVAFYALLANGGPRLVVVFCAGIAALVFFLLWKLWKREATISSWVPLLFALAIWVSAPRFLARPEMFSALFLVLLLAFLIAWNSGRFDDWLYQKGVLDASLVAVPLIVLFFLWVNFHALVGLGFLILAATIICDFAQSFFGSDRFDAFARTRVRVLLAVGVLCACAMLCNPYGLGYYGAFSPVGGYMFERIDEWKPLWDKTRMLDYLVVEALLLIVALMAWLFNPQRRWSHLVWLLIGAATLMQARRMLWLTAIIFIAVAAANARYLDTPTLWQAWRRLTRQDPFAPIPSAMRLLARAGALICLLVWAVSAAMRHTPRQAGSWNVVVRRVPEGAAEYLVRNPPRRVFNDYEDSSYLQWRLNARQSGEKIPARGRLPLFIDLLNAYPDRLMKEYFHVLDDTPRGREILKRRNVDAIVLGDHKFETALAKKLPKDPQWKQVFRDKDSMIWRRADSLADSSTNSTGDSDGR